MTWVLNAIEPRPVQLEAARLSLTPEPKPGFAYFMEMRLGKTYTVINDFKFLRSHGVSQMLVIAPNRFKEGWRNELRAARVPDDWIKVMYPNNLEEIAYKDPRVLVVNYEALNSSRQLPVIKSFVNRNTLLVLDESVMVKSPTSIRFKVANKLAGQVRYVRILTGLPDPNGPQDYWAQLKLIDPTSGMEGFNYFAWRATFCKMGGWKARQVEGVKNETKLKRILKRCAFVARRINWAHTYDTDYEIAQLKMSDVQRKHYDDMEEEFMVWVGGEKVTVQQAVAKRTKMQQISSGFIYDQQGNALTVMPFQDTPKFLDLKERLETEMSGKVVIVAHYRHTVRMLVEAMASLGIMPFLLAGGDQMREFDRDIEVEKASFNTDSYPDRRVMIVQSTSAKYGHNLQGSKDNPCLDMVFYENTYNLDTRAQVEQRPQGVDMRAPLHVVDYASSTVELDIIRALQRKKELSEAILGRTRHV